MTILYFSAQYLPTPGGVERYTWNLARRAAAAGHRAVVVTSALPDLPERETDADGVEILRVPVFPLMAGRFPVLRPNGRFFAINRELWAMKPDFCVIQTRMYTESIWAARAAKQHHVPAIVIDHSTGYMPMGGGLPGWAGRKYEQFACGCIRRTGAAFYGVSRSTCRWLRTFGVEAAGELPNAVDPAELDALAYDEPRMHWRQDLHLTDQKLIAFVGRLIPEKGAAELARAAAAHPDWAVAVAGTGPQLEELRRIAPANVFCLGSLPHKEIVQLLSQADAYCLPTRYAEGFPTTLLEAAACRCPIVCTRTAGTDELLPGEGYGILLDDAEPADIRAGLEALFADDARRAEFAERCCRNLTEHFTWDIVSAKILEIAENHLKE